MLVIVGRVVTLQRKLAWFQGDGAEADPVETQQVHKVAADR